jgi:hypothetical protein
LFKQLKVIAISKIQDGCRPAAAIFHFRKFEHCGFTKFQKDWSNSLKVIVITKIAAKIQDGGIKPEVEIQCVP